MLRTRLLLLSMFSLLAACDDDGIRFADASDEQRRRAVVAAMGIDGKVAASVAFGFLDGSGPKPACPAIQTAGDVVTVTGGCVLDNGWRIDGQAVVTWDPDKSGAAVRFEDLRGSDPKGLSYRFSGTVDYRQVKVDGSIRSGTVVSHLSSDFSRVGRADSDVEVTCDENHECRTADGATLGLPGLGTAEVVGTWNHDPGKDPVGGRPSVGVIELRGADTLRVDLAAIDQSGCAPATIDGKAAGTVCLIGEPRELYQ